MAFIRCYEERSNPGKKNRIASYFVIKRTEPDLTF